LGTRTLPDTIIDGTLKAALKHLLTGPMLVHDLQCDQNGEVQVMRPIDNSRAALANHCIYVVIVDLLPYLIIH
jgi:hypothetical protein